MAATRRALVGLVHLGLLAWMALAIFFFPIGTAWLRTGVAAAVPIGALAAVVVVRPLRRVALGVLAAFLVVLGAWLAIPPSHQRSVGRNVSR